MSNFILKTLETRELKLNTIRLRGFYGGKLRKGSGGGGSGEGFPQLPGDVTRWHFGGLTNEMMAAMDDPRIEDADHKGRFLSFKNFARSGMSGAGGYNQNFNQWGYGNLPPALQTYTPHKMELNIPSTLRTGNVYSNLGKEGDIYDFTLKIVGLKDGASLRITKGVVSGNIERIEKDGIYKIYQPLETSWDQLRIYIVIMNPNLVDLNITIEQLPLYPGFILGDGVDDYAVTEEQLNFEDTYTVYTAFIPFQNDPVSNMRLCGKDSSKDFYMNYTNLYAVSFFSIKGVGTHLSKGFNLICCKRTTNKLLIKNLITGQQDSISSDALIHNPGLYYLWRDVVGIVYAKAAIAGQIIDNGHFATDEEDVKVLAWYKKEYPWLFFDQAWTVAGKSNEDADRDTIANITGNGNDLVLSNFGFAEGSGYNEEGEYAGYLVTDGVDDKIQSKRFLLHRNWTMVGDWRFMPPEKHTNSGIVKSPAIRLYNQLNNITLYINRTTNPKTIPSRSIKAVCSDGRIYLDDWSEFLDTELQTDFESDATITIANYGVGFTKMVFKNLSFYDNQLLDKEDCIKAYNYLQTLKAK